MTETTQNPIGRPTLYNPEIHPASLLEMADKGETVIEFCAKHNICDATFYRWVQFNPAFSDAFRRAKPKMQAFMITTARRNWHETKDERFNDKLYSILMRTAYKMTPDDRAILIEGFAEAKTTEERTRIIINAMATAEITASEAERLLSIVKTAANITELGAMAERIKELEAANGVANPAE